jgi:hypothetical protein
LGLEVAPAAAEEDVYALAEGVAVANLLLGDGGESVTVVDVRGEDWGVSGGLADGKSN